MSADGKRRETMDTRHSSTPSLLPLTYRHVAHALWRSRSVLVGLGLISVFLGVVPTLKSELESGLINQLNDEIRDVREGQRRAASLPEILSHPLRRFGSHRSEDAGLPERLAGLIF